MSGPFFGEDAPRYPDVPGYRRRDTSKAAADGVAMQAKTLRQRVLEAIRVKPGTPEQIAKRLGEPVMNIRPRTSELSRQGLIVDSGKRGAAMGGRQAIIWRAS